MNRIQPEALASMVNDIKTEVVRCTAMILIRESIQAALHSWSVKGKPLSVNIKRMLQESVDSRIHRLGTVTLGTVSAATHHTFSGEARVIRTTLARSTMIELQVVVFYGGLIWSDAIVIGEKSFNLYGQEVGYFLKARAHYENEIALHEEVFANLAEMVGSYNIAADAYNSATSRARIGGLIQAPYNKYFVEALPRP